MSTFVDRNDEMEDAAAVGVNDGTIPYTRMRTDSYTVARLGTYALAALRVVIGWTFLWAFVDKLFGWGYATKAGQGWIDGGSPTEGFLKFGATGPFEDFYHSIAGDTWADWLFMIGLLGIGVAMLLGVTMRIGGAAGALLYLLMWSVVLPPENNPVTDEHIIGALVMVVLAAFAAGDHFGLGKWWKSLPIVKRFPILR
jgi:thiosulfate dehydrogenase [quinone] large subunit